MKNLLFQPICIFNRKVPKFIQNIMFWEFMRLRPYACEALNPHFAKWNSEYDKLRDFRVDYTKFICKKQREVLKQVNKEHFSWFIRLDVDEESGDICAKSKIGNLIMMTLELKPIES